MLPARRPYPDELCCSAVFRCCRQFNLSFKVVGEVYLGRQSWRPTFLGASPLNQLAALFAMSAEDLLWRHTVFPYATAMMQPQYYENALGNALGHAPALGCRLAPVTQNVTCGVQLRRYCAACVEEDLKSVHESYWHRVHHLPGVLICVRHGCFLHESQLPIKSSGPFARSLPHECKSGRVVGRGEPSPALISIAKTSAAWLDREPGPGEPIHPTTYRDVAVGLGWLSSDREVEVQLIAKALVGAFTKSFLAQGGAPVSARPGFWGAMMLRPSSELPFTPFKHAAMQALLAEGPSTESPPLDRYGGGPGASSATEMDSLYSREARKELRRVTANGRCLTTEEFLRGVGCWGAYRHRMGEMPKLRAVVREFRGSAVTVKRLRPGKRLYKLSRPDDVVSSP